MIADSMQLRPGRLGRWLARRQQRWTQARIARWAARNAAFVQRHGLAPMTFAPDGRITVRADNGSELLYDPAIRRSAIDVERNHTWEPRYTELLLEQLPADGVFLDCGANCGWFTLAAGRSSPEVRVHAFEPVPATFGLLAGNVALNGLANVTVNNRGLWHEPTELRFTCDRGPKNHIVTGEPNRPVQTVLCIRLDDYVAEKGLARVDLIKCDVEGAELPALRGARGLLERFGPTIMIELTVHRAKRFDYHPAEVFDLLAGLGYGYSIITEADEVRPASGDVEADLATGHNFLFRK